MTVTWEALGKDAGLKATLASFCERQIAALPAARSRPAVRRLCEYGLISVTGRRLSLEEGEIQLRYTVARETLAKLVELRLLRADTRVGSIYYELSHDTLVQPILEWRRRRERRRNRVLSSLVVVLGATVLWLLFGEPAMETARRALMVALTPESTRRALADDLKWTQIPAPAWRPVHDGLRGRRPAVREQTKSPVTRSRSPEASR